jgi:hypothetical protein
VRDAARVTGGSAGGGSVGGRDEGFFEGSRTLMAPDDDGDGLALARGVGIGFGDCDGA